MHDSVAFYPAFEKLINRFGVADIVNFLGDAAYKTPHICKTLIDLELTPLFPYKRSMNKDGYIIYKADQNYCTNCPFKEKCTKMKAKQILRHVWEDYKEMVEELRYD